MADVAVRLFIVAVTVAATEVLAALVHRLWMHGPGWSLHRSHHTSRGAVGHGREGWPAAWEWNDLHAVLPAVAAVVGFVVGHGRWWPLWWVAVGLTVYGALYLVVHDVLVHRRGPWAPRWTPRRGYLARLVQAHRLHHAVHRRDGAVSFGFLYAPLPARLARQLRERWRDGAAAAARDRQGAIGLLLAALIVVSWSTLTVWALWFQPPGPSSVLLASLVIAVLTWLDVGLFIVAHDAMHGSLVPGWRRLNRAVGRLCLLLYCGFLLHRFEPGHHAHHRRPGTTSDPDFHPEGRRFWPWYATFMRRYMGAPELVAPIVIFLLLAVVLRAPVLHVVLFWAVPTLLSSLQLFAFGTWLPHRRAQDDFTDAHRARSSGYGTLRSLLTCFHFGYHHEHHLRPDAPWWRLPAVRRARAADAVAAPVTPAGVSTAAREAPRAVPERPAPARPAPP